MIIGNTDTARAVYVIAEIGGNHNGSPETAYKLVEMAAAAGANAVKFQTYRGETLVHPSVEPLPIVKRHYATQLERFKSLELDWAVYERIVAQCGKLGIDFITTPFDLDILHRMAPFMPAIKIASGDLTYVQLIRAAAATGKPVILSTGMATVDEIDAALGDVPAAQRVLLHCASIYPLPPDQANLRAIPTMSRRWPDVPIGYSDHTVGIEACVAAVALGAAVIEKHFTLDKSQVPGDHVLSADPDDLATMVRFIRNVRRMLGDGVKQPSAGETEMGRKMRRGVYAKHALSAGHRLTAGDLLLVRPVAALAPADAEAVLGRKLLRDIPALAPLARGDVG